MAKTIIQHAIIQRSLCAAAVLMLATGCQSLSPTPSNDQMSAGDFGPKPANIEAVIRAHLADQLFDPDSLKEFSVTEPLKCGKKRGFGTPVYGWCASYRYNAKNRYGGYVGKTDHTVMIYNDRIIFEDGLFTD